MTGRLSEEPASPHDVAHEAEGRPQPTANELPQARHGIVQLSTTDYDDIASNHPRARLTYIDDDDGELITVS